MILLDRLRRPLDTEPECSLEGPPSGIFVGERRVAVLEATVADFGKVRRRRVSAFWQPRNREGRFARYLIDGRVDYGTFRRQIKRVRRFARGMACLDGLTDVTPARTEDLGF